MSECFCRHDRNDCVSKGSEEINSTGSPINHATNSGLSRAFAQPCRLGVPADGLGCWTVPSFWLEPLELAAGVG